jgi:RimJ/RimL family protein N-acetyltransferase
MSPTRWPLTGLQLRTADLELRWPAAADLDALADLAADGIHDPGRMPFEIPWTDAPPEERAQSVLQYQWSCWASWRPSRWTLELAVVRAGVVVGVQGVSGRDFAVLREVRTGSWLGRRYQGQGIGTQMRAAVLHLAFAGLGAQHAVTAAYTDNAASLRVSRKLGYREDGIEQRVVRGQPMVLQRFRLTRADWQAVRSRPDLAARPVQITGLPACLPLFGLRAGAADPGGPDRLV